jgi:hypothetical protein
MMSFVAGADSGSRPSAALLALVPTAAGAVVHFVLGAAVGDENSENASKLVEVVSAAAVILVGAPFARQAVQRDEQRAVQLAESNVDSSGVSTPSSPSLIVPPSGATIALAAVLGAAAFWLLDLLISFAAYGSLGAFGEQVPYDDAGRYRTTAIRGLPVLLVGVFPIAVRLSHRLRDRAGGTLKAAVVLYVLAVIATNRLWAGGPFIPEDIYIPILSCIAVYVACVLGRGYAARTQDRFDLIQAARLQSEVASRSRQ